MLELFQEFKAIFKDNYLHLGMDEVYYSCWMSNPDIIEWMQKMKFTSLHQIEQYYVERTLANVKNKVKIRYQQWQDPLVRLCILFYLSSSTANSLHFALLSRTIV